MDKKTPHKPEKTNERRFGKNASLVSIFRDESGGLPDLTKLEPHVSHRIVFVLIGAAVFLLVLIIAAWLGFIWLKPYRGFTGHTLQVQVDGPERVTLGQETTFFVNWKNIASEPLATAEMRVSFPVDFVPTHLDPQPAADGLIWRLGSIPFGGRGTITIRGIFTGALGTQTAIQVVGTYRPASFNSDFEALATRSLEYADTVLDGKIIVPEKSLPGDKIVIVYTLQNRGSIPIKGLLARLTLPEGFVRDATSSGSVLDGPTVTFSVGDLNPEATTTVSVSGVFASGISGDQAVHGEVGRTDFGGAFLPALKTDAHMEVLAGDLNVHLVVNGSTADRSIGFGDVLHIAIGYENTAPEDIQSVTIRLHIEPVVSSTSLSQVDWTQLNDASSGTRAGNTLTWDKRAVGVLERLVPRTDGLIELAVPVMTYVSGTPIGDFRMIAEATMVSVGNTVVNRTIRTAPMTFRFHTDANIVSVAHYFSEEGAPLGSGPLPPIVGQTTAYQIEWSVTKHIHELKDVQITASVPKNVVWQGNPTVSAGTVTYDEKSRTVIWSLNRLPAEIDEATANFNLQLTPTLADVGRFADVLGAVQLQATDAEISEPIIRNTPAMTTDLQNDEGAKGKGVVRKP